MKPPSKFENVTGSLPVAVVSTLVAAAANPIAALLPVLTFTLAHGRHKKRIEEEITEIQETLSRKRGFNELLTDAQYKLVSEIVVSILSTVDDEKLEHLKNAVFNTPLQESLKMHDATVLSRVLNNISNEELAFLVECHGKVLSFGELKGEGVFNIDRFSADGEKVTGLVSLGLLTKSGFEGIINQAGWHHFTALADKLVRLITGSNTQED